MKRLPVVLCLLVLSSLLTVLPAWAQGGAVLDANLTDECAAEYDPNVDYFPDKVEITDAVNFSVEYFNNYKVVTVTNAFDGAEPFTYVLTQCGTPAPDAADFPGGTQFIEVPAGDIITMSTTQLPHLIQLGLLDKLVGLDSFLFVNSPEVRALIDAGQAGRDRQRRRSQRRAGVGCRAGHRDDVWL
jgi:iron complex transport system substrate-binding protein